VGHFSWRIVVYALLSLTVVRMLPVFLVLLGTGLDLRRQLTTKIDIEALCKAASIKRVVKVDPYNLEETTRIFKEEFGIRTVSPGVRTKYSKRDFSEESLMLTGDLNILDIDYLTRHVYHGGSAPVPVYQVGDMDNSGVLDQDDIDKGIHLLENELKVSASLMKLVFIQRSQSDTVDISATYAERIKNQGAVIINKFLSNDVKAVDINIEYDGLTIKTIDSTGGILSALKRSDYDKAARRVQDQTTEKGMDFK